MAIWPAARYIMPLKGLKTLIYQQVSAGSVNKAAVGKLSGLLIRRKPFLKRDSEKHDSQGSLIIDTEQLLDTLKNSSPIINQKNLQATLIYPYFWFNDNG